MTDPIVNVPEDHPVWPEPASYGDYLRAKAGEWHETIRSADEIVCVSSVIPSILCGACGQPIVGVIDASKKPSLFGKRRISWEHERDWTERMSGLRTAKKSADSPTTTT